MSGQGLVDKISVKRIVRERRGKILNSCEERPSVVGERFAIDGDCSDRADVNPQRGRS